MRIYLIFILSALALARAGFAATNAEIFTKGFEFFARGDYAAAKEMFAQIPADDAELGALAAYYAGSICAFEGSPEAAKYFEAAMRGAKPRADGKNPARTMAVVQFARLCFANAKYAEFLKGIEGLPADYADSETDFYTNEALWRGGKTDAARAGFAKMLKTRIADPAAAGVDLFLQARAESEDFARCADAELEKLAAECSSEKVSDAAKARLEIFGGKKISRPRGDISFYARVVAAEESPESVDKSAFAEEIYKNRNSPFAWRGALALGKIYFEAGDYKAAAQWARDCLRLSNPDIRVSRHAIMLAGDCHRMMKNYDEARAEYAKIFMDRRSRGEPIAESLYKTGVCWFEQGDWATAHAYFQRVFVAFFKFEYWGSRAYYYDAQALYSLKQRRDANATLLEYFRRAKDRNSEIYKAAKKYYNEI